MAEGTGDRTRPLGDEALAASGQETRARRADATAPAQDGRDGSARRLIDERVPRVGLAGASGRAGTSRAEGAAQADADATRLVGSDVPTSADADATRPAGPGEPSEVWPPEDAGLYVEPDDLAEGLFGDEPADTGAGGSPAATPVPPTLRSPDAQPAPGAGISPGDTAPRRVPPDATRAAPVIPRGRPRAASDTSAGQYWQDVSASTPAQASAAPDARRDTPRGHRRRPRHGFLSFLLWLAMLAVWTLLAARMLPASYASGRAVPELVSLVPLTLPVCAVVLVLAVLWGRKVLAVVTGVALALVLWWHQGYFLPSGSLTTTAEEATAAHTATTDDAVVRVMTLNCDNGGASAADVVALVRAQGVEVLALQECTDSFLASLQAAGISTYLPHYVASTPSTNDNGGYNCLFTAAPMADASSDLVPTLMSKMCAGSVSVGGATLRFVSAHPNSPHLGGEDLWGEGLDSIASLSGYDHAYVICGDFNSTWDHARFRELLGTSFVDAGEQAGEGFHMTYPSSTRIPALIEIDHVVYSDGAGLFVGDLGTERVGGTDHLALLATLEVQGA